MTTLSVYIGMNNKDQLRIMQDSIVVANGIITKAQISFGPYSIVTGTDSNIRLTTNATVVEMELGKTPLLVAGRYEGRLTIYDASSLMGIAWSNLEINVMPWAI